jgi:pilus assembly protein CpaC
MRRLGLLLAFLFPVLLAIPLHAQQPVGGSHNNVTVPEGEGRLFRLDHDATNVFVANAQVADVQVVSPRLVYVYGRKVGQTTLTAASAQEGAAGSLTIRVVRNAAAAQATIPGARAANNNSGPIALSFIGDRLVVRGVVNGVGEAMDVEAAAQANATPGIPPLDRTRLMGTQQITLRVRIAEVSRNDLNNIGINWNVLARPGSFTLGLLTGGFVSGFNAAETFGAASAAVNTSRVNAEALLNALQREGVLTMLAEPNLTTLSGETARFLAGGEVPIPVPQSFGVTTIEYKQYGVSLGFTPVLLPDNRIAMRVRPEVSQIDSANAVSINGTSVPAFTTRSTETNVEMASGQTVAIAGLFQRSLQDSIDRFPFLGDVPVLGALFRSQRFQRNETELVILITPYLSAPVSSPDAFPLPTDDATRTPGRPLGVNAGFVVN